MNPLRLYLQRLNWHAEGYANTAGYLSKLGFQVDICGEPNVTDHRNSHAKEPDILNLVEKEFKTAS